MDYVNSSLILVTGVAILVLIIGTVTAWTITNYNFIGKNIFEWALILPLSIPPYILAYTFTGLFDPYGDANNLIRYLFDLSNDYVFFPNVRSMYGAIIVFAFTLYPYVYLTTRMAFLNQSRSLMEAGKLLGNSTRLLFFRLAVPLVRPAIIAGLALVIMETLSAVSYTHLTLQTKRIV